MCWTDYSEDLQSVCYSIPGDLGECPLYYVWCSWLDLLRLRLHLIYFSASHRIVRSVVSLWFDQSYIRQQNLQISWIERWSIIWRYCIRYFMVGKVFLEEFDCALFFKYKLSTSTWSEYYLFPSTAWCLMWYEGFILRYSLEGVAKFTDLDQFVDILRYTWPINTIACTSLVFCLPMWAPCSLSFFNFSCSKE